MPNTIEKKYFDEYKAIKGRLWREELAVETRIPFELIDRTYRGARKVTELEVKELNRAINLVLGSLAAESKQGKTA